MTMRTAEHHWRPRSEIGIGDAAGFRVSLEKQWWHGIAGIVDWIAQTVMVLRKHDVFFSVFLLAKIDSFEGDKRALIPSTSDGADLFTET